MWSPASAECASPVEVRHRVHHEVLVVALRVVLAHVGAAALLAVAGRVDDHLREVEQEAELDGLEQVGVEPLALVLHGDVLVALAQPLDDLRHLGERLLGAEHLGVAVHRVLQLLADRRDPLGAGRVAQLVEHALDGARRVLGQRHELRGAHVLDGVLAGALAEHVDVEQRVGAEAVRAVHRHARALAGGVEPGHDGRVVAQHLGLDVGRDAAHRVVRGRQHRHGLGVRLDAEVGAGELGDVGQLRVDHRGLEVGDVEVDVVLVRAGAATLADLGRHAARDDVARREVLDRGGVALHEALALAVAQDRALTAGGLGEQDAEARPARSGGTGRTPCPRAAGPCAR